MACFNTAVRQMTKMSQQTIIKISQQQ